MTTSINLVPSIYKITSYSFYVAPTPGFNSFDPDCEPPAPTHIRVECIKIYTSGNDQLLPIIGVKPLVVFFSMDNRWAQNIIEHVNDDKTIYIAGCFEPIRLTEEYQMMHPFD